MRYEGVRGGGGLPGGFAPASRNPAQNPAAAHIAQFFRDLRTLLGISHQQVAAQLLTHPDVIQALENADVRMLPPWPETSRIVMNYTAWARIDGRPVLDALGSLMQAAQQAPPRPQRSPSVPPQLQQSVARLRQAGVVAAAHARKLPERAMNEARARPARTFYAVSLPLALVLLGLNTSIVQGAVGHVAKPITSFATSIRDALSVTFAPVREGLRWIEVEDPRTRRGDKLADGER